jgi:diguanylate cyclase (GGDEF)-like protein
MPANKHQVYLLASPDPDVLRTVEPVLQALGATVQVVMSANSALEVLTGSCPPAVAVLDTTLPGMEPGQLLAAARTSSNGRDFPIVLISDTVTQEWADRLIEGIIDDVILRDAGPDYWRLRLDLVLRARRMGNELESLREASAVHAQIDHLTGVFNREAMLSMLFRETDRVQRLKSSLCLILFDVDDFGHWNERLGVEACDELLCKAVERTNRILRSYDVLGRPGKDEFLLLLPGCTTVNAVMLAERLRLDVFSTPFRAGGESIRLSACFGVATSMGRSPVVVLREAEQALQWAKESGPESIEYFGDSERPAHAPVTYLSPSSGDELLAW